MKEDFKKLFWAFCIIIYLFTVINVFGVFADSTDILKDGLLGGASGAVGGAASGAKGGELWKGALAGAGVNVVGGALIDAVTNKPAPQATAPTVVAQPQIQYVDRPVEKIVYVDKPVEVEKIVYQDRPVEKIVYVEKVPPGLAKKAKEAEDNASRKGYADGYRQAMSEVCEFSNKRIK